MLRVKQKLLGLVVLSGIICATIGSIASPSRVAAVDSFAMGIDLSGVFIEDLRAGQTEERSFNVSNQGHDPFDIEVVVGPYSLDDNSETNYLSERPHTEISRWITLNIHQATIEPGKSAEIKYTITVPDDPPSGAQNAIINVTSFPNDSAISIGKSFGHTVHANIIDGRNRTEVDLAVHDVPGFLFSGYINSTIRIDNTGNMDVPVSFKIAIYNFFDEDLIYDREIPRFMSLPGSKVTKNLNWEGTPLLGIFKVDSIVEMLDETYVIERVVIVLPIFIIILFILVVGLVITFCVNKSKARKQKLSHPNVAS